MKATQPPASENQTREVQVTCPHANLRSDLPPLTERIAALPVDGRGYPVPFFVQWIDGKPDFRVVDTRRFLACLRDGLCWVCGKRLGVHLTFPIGPMCALNRTTAEPPSHHECAQWSVKGCPFLSKPHMVRREDEMTRESEANVAGFMIKRNPGVTCLWTTRTYQRFADGRGGMLIRVGPHESVEWWREGRAATRAEVLASIDSGLPLLREQCDLEDPRVRPKAHAELDQLHAAALLLLPTS